MQIPVKFFKVLGLPSEPVANAFYFVEDEVDGVTEMWLTDADGEAFKAGNSEMILTLLTWANISGKPSTFSATSHNHDDLYFTEAEMTTALVLKAALASPTFTGTPLAPTAVPGTNTTQIATTAFVLQVRDALLNSPPGALDTLDELAAALGDDANFATTVTAALAARQPLDADLTAIAALDSATAGAIASDGAGWMKKTYAQLKTALGLVKADVGLSNVDNTSDSNKPVSTLQQTALNLKSPLANPLFYGSVTINTDVGDPAILLSGTQVLTVQQLGIASFATVGDPAEDKINEILTVLRSHGLIEP